jgi:hypothetical protein
MASRNSDAATVQLYISCRKLKDVETFSKSDPFVEVFERVSTPEWTKLGQTEVIWDNLNPNFVKYFSLEYYFEVQQFLLFKVFDANIEQGREVKGQQIGEVECSLGEIAGAKGQTLIKDLHLPNLKKKTGNIILRIEKVDSINMSEVKINFAGRRLKSAGWGLCCGLSPLFCLSRTIERGVQRVYMSEASKGPEPIWLPMIRSLHDLCNGDENQVILFELFDESRNGTHKLIGSFEFTLKMISEGKNIFQLLSSKSKDMGEIYIHFFEITEIHDFLQYIAGGCQISLMIAVDFTGSNGDPMTPNSLHFISNQGLNLYQSALYSVSEILLNYDSDKVVPLYGFGAKLNRNISHCFPLNFNENNPNVSGLQEIMECYKKALPVLQFSGPTLFTPVISTAVKMAEAAQVNQLNQNYFILLILTDGEIHDMNETIDWIVKGSFNPLSIVIVGIGNEDFSKMEILDADENPLIDSKGVKMARDIVQFVPFRNFGNSPSALTKEVLAEIPREITNFFKMKKIIPNGSIIINDPFTDNQTENHNEMRENHLECPAVNQLNNNFSKAENHRDSPGVIQTSNNYSIVVSSDESSSESS